MTIKSPSIRCFSGAVLLLLFLVFLAVSSSQDTRRGIFPDDNVPTLVSAIAEPITLRNSTNANLAHGFCLKAAGPCLLAALFGFEIVISPVIRASALKINLPRHNPFYVFITTNAP